ncbi:MAG TPA: DUF1501 domain-containing protein [Verrucomicrobiae bacterium]|jgi:hypothetical protein
MSDLTKYLRDHTPKPQDFFVTRRQFLERFGMGFGVLGLATLLGERVLAAPATAEAIDLSPLSPKAPHFPAKAKRVVHIFAQGAPSQVDTWDPKPGLARYAGQTLPGVNGVAMPSPFKFQRHGKSGIEVSEVFENLAQHVDDMAIIRSMHTDIPSHEVATVMMNTGSLRLPKPSMGSWILYGLGTENQNMPGFISLRPGNVPPGGTQNWQASFLPGIYQGTSINTKTPNVEQMIENIRNQLLTQSEQRHQLDLVHKLNALHSQNLQKDEQLEARIEAFEMAYKMQMEATDAFDISKEPQSVRDLYGNSNQGHQMLIARRLLERGVRVVQVWAGGWDHHNDLEDRLVKSAREIDKPAAAFLQDLKQRGLLDSTLVIWGGEFGRKPTRDKNGNANPGRDHNNRGFSVWLAGGGVKGGTVYGATDEFGSAAVENRVHVHDLHATILQLLGFNHEKLTYRYNGRDFRLTDVKGQVVKGVIA